MVRVMLRKKKDERQIPISCMSREEVVAEQRRKAVIIVALAVTADFLWGTGSFARWLGDCRVAALLAMTGAGGYFSTNSCPVGEMVISCLVVCSVGYAAASIAHIIEISFPENEYGWGGILNLNSFWANEPGLSNFFVSITSTSWVPFPSVRQNRETSIDSGLSCRFQRIVPWISSAGRNSVFCSVRSMLSSCIVFLLPRRHKSTK